MQFSLHWASNFASISKNSHGNAQHERRPWRRFDRSRLRATCVSFTQTVAAHCVAIIAGRVRVTTPLLTLSNLQILYDRVIEAVRDISLVVPAGRIIALLGSNGAGKSTVLKAISGVLEREDGEIIHGNIEFAGSTITQAKAHQIV